MECRSMNLNDWLTHWQKEWIEQRDIVSVSSYPSHLHSPLERSGETINSHVDPQRKLANKEP